MDFLPPIDLNVGIVVKLLLASALGGLVGLERELRGKPAGLRTNMFICAGSALFTILSETLAAKWGGDPTRVAAQLITGIGFIGAGSIIRARGSVHGLTTAATIFVLASIGMAVGGGMYWTGAFVAVTMLAALSALGWVERRWRLKMESRAYHLEAATVETIMNGVLPELERRRLSLQNFACRQQEEKAEVRFEVETSPKQHQELFGRLSALSLACRSVPVAGSEPD